MYIYFIQIFSLFVKMYILFIKYYKQFDIYVVFFLDSLTILLSLMFSKNMRTTVPFMPFNGREGLQDPLL